jgi:hypothetical protein
VYPAGLVGGKEDYSIEQLMARTFHMQDSHSDLSAFTRHHIHQKQGLQEGEVQVWCKKR